MAHVIIKDGVIVRSSDVPFFDKDYGASEPVDYEVVWHNGGLYKAGEVPAPANEDLFKSLRAQRSTLLLATDKYLLLDYPISDNELAVIKAYRKELRDLPSREGAPWDGGGKDTPWPKAPSFIEENG